MSSPKHLWSGHWQDDSDALARELAMRRANTPEQAAEEQPPATPRRRAPTSPATRPPAAPIPPRVKMTPRPAQRTPGGTDLAHHLRQRADHLRQRADHLRQRAHHLHERWHPPAIRRPRLHRPPWLRAALLAALALLIVAGGAYGLTRAVGSGGSPKASANAGTPWLGVELQSVPVNRVVITAVVPGGPAEASGLGPGDVITSVANHQINMPGDVTAAIAGMHPGDRVEVQIQRGGLPLAARVTLAARPPGYP